ncbi:MAG: hypothetical protein M0Q24_11480 [Sulfurimonas sp.]|uniref:hypothetical protein n=1 Tax=Sulfurimonas sp. TaxID=2022749 RepID=UPI0025E60F34|nr:hypothetical protein [Sulfurimonas sp.]MCK9492692.1 hypothetical protein [Sulfurimonas sp.]
MIAIQTVIYNLIVLDTTIKSLMDPVKLYFVSRPAGTTEYPYFLYNLQVDDAGSLKSDYTLTIDFYDRGSTSNRASAVAKALLKIFDREIRSGGVDSEKIISFPGPARFIPEEEDRNIWHLTADFTIRTDKKGTIGG